VADQYVAVQKADRPIYKGHGSPSKGHVTKPKTFGASGHSNASGGCQKSSSFGHSTNLTLSRSHQLLPLVLNSTVLWRKRHLGYGSTVGNQVIECPTVARDEHGKNWKMFKCR